MAGSAAIPRAKKTYAQDIAPFGVRLPDDMRRTLAQAAKAGSRSLNAEIVMRLARSIEGTGERIELAESKVGYSVPVASGIDIDLLAHTIDGTDAALARKGLSLDVARRSMLYALVYSYFQGRPAPAPSAYDRFIGLVDSSARLTK